MITLFIRYTLDANKLADFAAYAKDLQPAIERCGGRLRGYYLPTKLAGPTNIGLALIDFPSLGAYEQYRAALLTDAEAAACLGRAERAGCILVEDRSFVRRVTATE
jgi:NIPSNAP